MSNIKFYTKKDVSDSLLLSNNGLTLDNSKLNLYITETNNEYERLCNGKGAYDDDIILNDLSTEKDERNSAMVIMCEWFFLSRAFFALSKKKDDIYWVKYEKSEEKFDEYRNLLTYDKITGERPPVKQANSFMSASLNRG